jgi:isopentenyl phosphate kinase
MEFKLVIKYKGFAKYGVSRLNRMVIEALLREGVNACSVNPSSIITAENGKVESMFLDSITGMLQMGVTPVLFGDIVYDKVKGCQVFSTEDLFEIVIRKLLLKKYAIETVIHLTVVDGVLDNQGRVIPHIMKSNFEEVKKLLYKAHGYDVTGGMLHKVQKALDFAKKGIKTYIINGQRTKKLYAVVQAQQVSGTCIRLER